jgi:excisionase family DNA binding protein
VWNLPSDLLPAVERALLQAEASFREAVREPVSEGTGLTWPPIESAIGAAIDRSFRAFYEQACLAVQERGLPVFQARAGGQEFLRAHAGHLHEWLVPVLDGHQLPDCRFSFRRDNSNDRSIFVRAVVERLQSSRVWIDYLQDLNAAAAGAAGEGQIKHQTAPLDSTEPAVFEAEQVALSQHVDAASASEIAAERKELPTSPAPVRLADDRVPLSVQEAAERLGVSKHTIYRMEKRGKIHIATIGERIKRVPQAEIERLLATGKYFPSS